MESVPGPGPHLGRRLISSRRTYGRHPISVSCIDGSLSSSKNQQEYPWVRIKIFLNSDIPPVSGSWGLPTFHEVINNNNTVMGICMKSFTGIE